MNVVGLGIGLAVSIVILLYLKSELEYDQQVPEYENIYRIQSGFEIDGQLENFAGSGRALGPLLKRKFNYINQYTRLFHIENNVLFKRGDIRRYQGDIAVADSNYFNVFKVPFIHGSASSALCDSNSIVVTETFAQSYFDGQNPLGKTISTNNNDYIVTGVIDDFPSNSHHSFAAVVSAVFDYGSLEEQLRSLWVSEVYTFLKLEDGKAESLQTDFKNFYSEYMAEIGENLGSSYQIYLTRLDHIHFGDIYQYDRPRGDIKYIYAFFGIGLLILILASINYINMAMAKSLKRYREIGLRKVLGADKQNIRLLFLTESFILSLVSLFMAFVVVELLLELTPLNEVLGKDLSLNFRKNSELFWLPLSLSLLVGFLSGIYPAVYLSNIPSIAVIRSGKRSKGQGFGLRKLLVGFQFTASIAIVITAILMLQQMQFIRDKDLGFNKDNLILMPIQDTITLKSIPQIQKALLGLSQVKGTTIASSAPGGIMNRTLVSIEKDDGQRLREIRDLISVGADYFQTMRIPVVQGKGFTREDYKEDLKHVMVNQAMVEHMGWDDPLGKKVEFGYDETGKAIFKTTVVGVSQDFNTHSLHQPISPLVILPQNEPGGVLHIRVDSDNLIGALNRIENVWGEVEPNTPFRFSLLDKDLMKLYEEEQRQSKIILCLTYIAIFISFLGLTGLVSFTVSQRTKEIAIRKVLGASSIQTLRLIFNDMLKLVLVSVFSAVPFAYFLTKGWLSNFAYSTNIDPLIFLYSGLGALLVAYGIVTYHSWAVSRSNPVSRLKNN